MQSKKVDIDVRNVIGDRVEQLRKHKGLTQKDLTVELLKKGVSISPSGLSKLEKKIRKVTDIEVVALADALGVSVNYLLESNE
ncbi:MAG: helix-turn-helix transcriptional regulator [Acutalibacteraceae bacterium]|nr:helix-turn-helix transcriptional regulator [Acutalibacteraceae bacterium]